MQQRAGGQPETKYHKAEPCMLAADTVFEMQSNKPSVYNSWQVHPNIISTSPAVGGMTISLRPGEYPYRSLSPSNNKSPIPIPNHQVTVWNSLEGLKAEERCTQLESKVPFPIRNLPLERFKDLPTPLSTQPSIYASNRNTESVGSSRKILQLTGLDLNTGGNIPPNNDDDDDNVSLQDSDSPTNSASSGSMYSQPVADYDMGAAGYLGKRGPPPRSSGILLQSTTYQSPKLLHMNQQPPRALRHTDRRNMSQKVKTDPIAQPENVTKVNIQRNVFFQGQQQQMIGYDAGYIEYKHALAHPGIAELEDTEVDAGSLMPRPLAIRTKKKPVQNPTKTSFFQSAADSWSYGVNELITPSTTPFSLSDHPQPLSSHTRVPTPVSPMGSMESDHISLPLLPDTPPVPNRRFGSGKHPLKSPFPFSSKTYEELDSTPSPTERQTSPRSSGKLSKVPRAKSPPHNKARNSNGSDKIVANRGAFTGLKVLQKGNGNFKDVMEKAREKMLKKSADEKRRASLKGKIFVVGITDQTPDGRVSEWL